jgi:type IV pilus assembly protein PilA
MTRIRQRLGREEGFTLIELLVVIVIIGILLAIAVPSYLGFRGRAQDSAAQANLRAAVPSAEAHYSANNSYATMTVANLKSTYDSGLKDSGTHAVRLAGVAGEPGTAPDADSYCFIATGKSGTTFKFEGPGGEVVAGVCP